MSGVEPSTEHPAPPDDRPELPAGILRDPPATRRREVLPDFPVWAPFAAAVLTLIVAFVGLEVARGIAAAFGHHAHGNDLPAGVTIAGTYVQDVALVVTSLLLMQLVSGHV